MAKFSLKSNKSKNIARYIAMAGVATALVAAATISLQIPIAVINGYFNLGDCIIFIAAVLCGPIVGGIAGGIGSMLADIMLGYAVYALPTLIIKGLEGVICGIIADFVYKKFTENRKQILFTACGMLIASIEMIIGYFFAGWILFGSESASFAAVLPNIVQGGLSTLIAMIILYAFGLKNRVRFIR